MRYSLSIIIPVLNETETINRTFEDLEGINFKGKIEIIVVDGNPLGNTYRAISEKRRSGLSIKKICAPKGRGSQLNKGASIAKGDVLLFLHADTTLGQKGFDGLFSVTENRNIAVGAFDLGIRSNRKIFRVIEKVSSMRSRITKIPYGDQAIFIHRCFFRQIGGFSDIPIMEDVELMQRIKKTKKRIKILKNKALTSSRRWDKEGVFYCTFRNWILINLYFMGVSPEKLAKFYQPR